VGGRERDRRAVALLDVTKPTRLAVFEGRGGSGRWGRQQNAEEVSARMKKESLREAWEGLMPSGTDSFVTHVGLGQAEFLPRFILHLSGRREREGRSYVGRIELGVS